MKKSVRLFVCMVMTIASAFAGCSGNGVAEESIAVAEESLAVARESIAAAQESISAAQESITGTQTAAPVTETAVPVTESAAPETEDDSKFYHYGTGYRLRQRPGWVWAAGRDGADIELIFNSMSIDDTYGVINMQITSLRLGENGFDSNDLGLQYYALDDSLLMMFSSLWGVSVEEVQELEKTSLNGEICFDRVYTSFYDIISYDLSEVPVDENGCYIMDNIDELSYVTHEDVPCTLRKFYVRNGDAAIKIEVIVPNDDLERLKGVYLDCLKGFELTEPLPPSEYVETESEEIV